MDALLEPLRSGIGQRAALEGVLVALACGPLGVWVVLLGQGYAAESISHAMLPGLVVAALLGAPLLLGGLVGVLVAAGAIALAGRVPRVGGDVAVAVAITTLFGLGAVLALSPEVPPRLGELLFGDLLGVTEGDLVQTGVLAAGVVAALAAAHRPLALAAFDAASAHALGGSPGRAMGVLLAVLATTTVAGVGALGNLLVVALILAPAGAALALTSRLRGALVLAPLLAALAGVLGLYASWYLELAAGASVALCAVAIFAVARLVGERGASPRRRHGGPIQALSGS